MALLHRFVDLQTQAKLAWKPEDTLFYVDIGYSFCCTSLHVPISSYTPGPICSCTTLLMTTIGRCFAIAATAAESDFSRTALFCCNKAQQMIRYFPGPLHPWHLGCLDACMCCPCALLASLVRANTVSVLLASVAHACQVPVQPGPHLQSA